MSRDAVALRYRFNRFELNLRDRTLLENGKPVPVGPRALDVLVVLLERAGELVSKDELLERVWEGLVVEENNLHVQVSALRKLLGAEAIATIQRHGYRFAWPVIGEASPARSQQAASGANDANAGEPATSNGGLPPLYGRATDLA